MAEKNPYDDLFSLKEEGTKKPTDDVKALTDKLRVSPSDQKAQDADIPRILQKALDNSTARLNVLRGKPIPANKEEAEALKASIARTEYDIAAQQRELKRAGVDVTVLEKHKRSKILLP